MRHIRTRAALVVLMLAAGAACHPPDERQAVGNAFVDRLFVVIDQHAARELAIGLAAKKIDEEIRLKDGQVIDAGTQKPNVTYRLVDSGTNAPDTVSFVYELHIQPEGVEAFERRLLLTLHQVDGAWRVANYTLEQPDDAAS